MSNYRNLAVCVLASIGTNLLIEEVALAADDPPPPKKQAATPAKPAVQPAGKPAVAAARPSEPHRGEHPHYEYHEFHERDFHRFGPAEAARWRGGYWRNEWHDGRLGWWWMVDGIWYYYDSPVYPHPQVVSEVIYREPALVASAPVVVQQPTPVIQAAPQAQSWYWCDNPQGYSPYVQNCLVPWRQVPAQQVPVQTIASQPAPAPAAATPPTVAAPVKAAAASKPKASSAPSAAPAPAATNLDDLVPPPPPK